MTHIDPDILARMRKYVDHDYCLSTIGSEPCSCRHPFLVAELAAEVQEICDEAVVADRSNSERLCTSCYQACQWVACPTGGWWGHIDHPGDEHDAIVTDLPPWHLRDDEGRVWRVGCKPGPSSYKPGPQVFLTPIESEADDE